MYSTLEKFIKTKTNGDAKTIDEICSYFKWVKTKRNQILLNYDQV
ncbi:hypothetical protein [Flavobacterium macacae]|nr:hypothetical protein [Flavobacterium macacae]